jgi:hypothetical protein
MRAGRERWSPWRRRGIPRRGTDWVETTTAWLVVSLGLVCLAVSLVVGVRVHAGLMDRAHQEAATRTPVRAVLLDDSTPLTSAVDQGSVLVAQVPVRYLDPNGAVREGLASVGGALGAGDTVTIWLDRAHHIVPRPTGSDDAAAAGYVSGGLVLVVSLAVLSLVWIAIRHVTLLRNCARWAREWAVVEPLWSGRAFGGRLP